MLARPFVILLISLTAFAADRPEDHATNSSPPNNPASEITRPFDMERLNRLIKIYDVFRSEGALYDISEDVRKNALKFWEGKADNYGKLDPKIDRRLVKAPNKIQALLRKYGDLNQVNFLEQRQQDPDKLLYLLSLTPEGRHFLAPFLDLYYNDKIEIIDTPEKGRVSMQSLFERIKKEREEGKVHKVDTSHKFHTVGFHTNGHVHFQFNQPLVTALDILVHEGTHAILNGLHPVMLRHMRERYIRNYNRRRRLYHRPYRNRFSNTQTSRSEEEIRLIHEHSAFRAEQLVQESFMKIYPLYVDADRYANSQFRLSFGGPKTQEEFSRRMIQVYKTSTLGTLRYLRENPWDSIKMENDWWYIVPRKIISQPSFRYREHRKFTYESTGKK